MHEPDRRFLLAAIIVGSAFALIGYMLAIHVNTVSTVISNSSKFANLTTVLDSLDKSNQTLFNVLLPVFGAWVGVVIAFYFGSEQAKKAQETLVKALSPQDEKLSEVKVRTLLDKFGLKPKTVKLTDKIKDVLAAFGSLSDLLVVGEDGKPLGILYKQEIVSTLPKLNEKGTLDPDPDPNKDENNKTLKDKLSEINNHLLIPNRKWDLQKSPPTIDNFATVSPDDSLLHARDRMYGISSQLNDVRCVVTESSGVAIGIFSYDSILSFTK